jgi:hypothetical protein
MSYGAAVRFLEQASYGADPAAIAKLQATGRAAWLAEQFRLPATPLPDAVVPAPGASQEGLSRLADDLDPKRSPRRPTNCGTAWLSLSTRFWSSPASICGSTWQYVPYLRILHEEAFGNYLAAARTDHAQPGHGPLSQHDEQRQGQPGTQHRSQRKLCRELLQLFTIGLVQLNPTELSGSPATYTPGEYPEWPRCSPGCDLGPAERRRARFRAPDNWAVPMIPIEAEHDTTAKAILPGVTLPAARWRSRTLRRRSMRSSTIRTSDRLSPPGSSNGW